MKVYKWWKSSATRMSYPSTLYVTVKGIIPPEAMEAATRSMFPIQAVSGRNIL